MRLDCNIAYSFMFQIVRLLRHCDQLLGRPRLPVHGPQLFRPGPDGRLGLLRRVQPHQYRGVVRRGPADPGRHRRADRQIAHVQHREECGEARPLLWHLYHHEPWLCRTHRVARQLEVYVQADQHVCAGLQLYC